MIHLVTSAQTFSADQIQTFLVVVGGMFIMNAGSVIGWVFSYFKRIQKMRSDINAAFRRIKEIEKHIGYEHVPENLQEKIK